MVAGTCSMLGRHGANLDTAKAQLFHAQPRPSIPPTAVGIAADRRVVALSSYNQAAALQSTEVVSCTQHARQHQHQLQQHIHTNGSPSYHDQQQQQQQLGREIRRCHTYDQLLSIVQQQGRDLCADSITSVLYKASMLAKSARRLHAVSGTAVATGARINHSKQRSRNSSKCPYSTHDFQIAQQLVSLCLQQLLEVDQQVTAQHLSNCLLSLAVLCSRGGPAAAAFSGSSSSSNSGLQQQQQQQQRQLGGAGVLQQFITPASSRALEQLLEAAAPQHQLQQLLELTCSSNSSSNSSGCLAAAELHQLVNIVYGLAVLPLRPAPHVLQQLLHHTQQHLQQQQHHLQQQLQTRVPKLLSQLLWAAATLQIQLPASWVSAWWHASAPLLAAFSAQDVANTAWAAATLRLQPPPAWLSGLMAQFQAVSGVMTGQGLANTLWGLALLQPAAVDSDLLLQLLQSSVKAAKRGDIDRQNLANIFWAVAKCSTAFNNSSSSSSSNMQLIHQQLQQLLATTSWLLPSLQPRDWSNILWACGHLQYNPGSTVLQQLWRKTPAGFNTSLNPHSIIGGSGTGSSSSSVSGMSGWSPQALGNCLWGCARIRAQPTQVWLQGFEAASISLLPGFSTQLLANTLWAFGQLGYRPSDTWMDQYWQQSHRMVQRLQQAISAAAGRIMQNDAGRACNGTSEQQQRQQQQQDEVDVAAAEIVMVLQAAGKLCLVPPLDWLQQAVAAITVAARRSNHVGHHQQQQQHQSIQLKTLTACIHSLGVLTQVSRSGSSSRSRSSSSSRSSDDNAVMATHAEYLLQQALQQHTTTTTSTNSQHNTSQHVPVHLSHMDVLMLLTALPLLPLSNREVATDMAVQLLARCWQLLENICSSSSTSRWSSKQLVQVAVSAARVVQRCCSRGALSSNSSSSLDVRLSNQLWAAVEALQQQQSTSGTVSIISSSFLQALCSQLQGHLDLMSAADVSRTLAAVVQLRKSGSSMSHDSSSTSTSAEVAGFITAAGAAVAHHMAVMTAHQRAAAAASLAQLGYCPSVSWLELLLLHSGCQLSSDACSSRDMVLLLQSMPMLLLHHQQHQEPQQQQESSMDDTSAAAAAGVVGQTQLPADAVAGWLCDWLDESGRRMSNFNPSQLVATASALQRLTSHLRLQQQQQGLRYQLPTTWRESYLSAIQQQLSDVTASQLVALLSSTHRLHLRPSHEWCAAVAAQAAVRAAAAAARHQQQGPPSSSGSSSRMELKVHHVGLLAYSLRKLAYRAPWQQRQQLLDFVLARCRRSSSSVTPKQLMQVMLLLPLSGWYPSSRWIRYFKRSKAVKQLRVYLSKQQHQGSWRVLERRFRSWEQLQTHMRRRCVH